MGVLEGRADEPCRITDVHRRPPVLTVTNVRRHAELPIEADERRDESVAVPLPVHRPRHPDEPGSDPAVGEAEHRRGRPRPGSRRSVRVERIGLGGRPRGVRRRPGSGEEGLAAVREGVADGGQQGDLVVDRLLERAEVEGERQVRRGVREPDLFDDAVVVGHVPADRPRAHGVEPFLRGVRPGEAHDVVSAGEEVADEGTPDPSGRAGDEDAQEYSFVMRLCLVTVYPMRLSRID